MSEYWKSTPKYWCKYCSVYVRDTKLERQNHEATGRHKGGLERELRNVHRNAEQADRARANARREVDRLNGVVSGPSSTASTSTAPAAKPPAKSQLEQLAELGVAIPTELRGEIAMPGEWTVTKVRVVEEKKEGEGEKMAIGVKRDREMTEEEKEQEEAIKGLFGKRRKWGVDSKVVGEEEDKELEELLSGGLGKKEEVKKEEEKEEVDGVVVKTEDGEAALAAVPEGISAENIKTEPGEVGQADAPTKEETDIPTVMFKKRKPKNIRQK